ncbi:MAG: sulfite exporter TauE/SafE family protein [bacterium]
MIHIDDELKKISEIKNIDPNFIEHSVEIEANFGNKNEKEIAIILSNLFSDRGYGFVVEKNINKDYSDFKISVPVAIIVIALFILLQKAGIANLVSVKEMNFWSIFLIGIVASLSTCMAVVGGFLLSLSATFSQGGDKVMPQILFHLGRLISFFFLGGVIGQLGATFQISETMNFLMILSVGLVMFFMGVNLLGVFDFAKRFQISMPKLLSKKVLLVSDFNNRVTPFVVGVLTFFLPCGFTQSMQFYALSTGSFFSGALTMFMFALGTLPVLVLIGFSSYRIKSGKKQSIFFKTIGIIIITMSLFNIINSLVVIGLIPPVF